MLFRHGISAGGSFPREDKNISGRGAPRPDNARAAGAPRVLVSSEITARTVGGSEGEGRYRPCSASTTADNSPHPASDAGRCSSREPKPRRATALGRSDGLLFLFLPRGGNHRSVGGLVRPGDPFGLRRCCNQLRSASGAGVPQAVEDGPVRPGNGDIRGRHGG